MKTYKAKIKLHSPLATRVRGDTLFGCVCWGIRYNADERELSSFLDRFDNNPFVISDGFPEGTLPRPLFSPEKHATAITIEQLNKRKRVKKMDFVPIGMILGSDKEPLEDKMIVDALAGLEAKMNELKHCDSLSMHNTINRLTNTVEEGALYSVNEMWFKEGSILDVYIVTSLDMPKTKQLLHWGLAEGYGADKSTGKGMMSLEAVEEIVLPDKGNLCLALGSFVPNDSDVLYGLRAFVVSKFGKLGGHFANSMNPFKRPFLMYTSGATFNASTFNGVYVGQLLKNIHEDPKIRHHACAPVLRFYSKEDKDETIQG
ncbi:MAG: hypothetical protein HY787_29665 [Deltaproteobacteria bacterium]|nr:hypothetical protein [Deltaproteobacteria bacterium]